MASPFSCARGPSPCFPAATGLFSGGRVIDSFLGVFAVALTATIEASIADSFADSFSVLWVDSFFVFSVDTFFASFST